MKQAREPVATAKDAATRLSACIIAFEEEDRIADCIESVRFCDEILVVDSHSTDRTREIAEELGCRVIERDWPGHVAQKDFAVRAAANDWVLCIDADERVSPELRDEILQLREGDFEVHAGWRMPRCSNYLGRWIRNGTWYPDWSLRLFDRRRGRWSGTDPHDRVELDEPPQSLRAELLHHPYRSLDDHLKTINRYTTIMARELHLKGRRARPWDLLLRPAGRFFVFYFWRTAFRDGWRGLVMAVLASYYVFLKYAKLYALEREVPVSHERG